MYRPPIECALQSAVVKGQTVAMTTDWVDVYREAWNSHDGARVAALMATDAVYEDLAGGNVYDGREAIRAYVEGTHDFSSDYVFLVVSAQGDDTRYAIEWEMLGTDTGGSGGSPATGRSYRIRGVSVGELDGSGLITANRDYWNLADYLTQVGLL